MKRERKPVYTKCRKLGKRNEKLARIVIGEHVKARFTEEVGKERGSLLSLGGKEEKGGSKETLYKGVCHDSTNNKSRSRSGEASGVRRRGRTGKDMSSTP